MKEEIAILFFALFAGATISFSVTNYYYQHHPVEKRIEIVKESDGIKLDDLPAQCPVVEYQKDCPKSVIKCFDGFGCYRVIL